MTNTRTFLKTFAAMLLMALALTAAAQTIVEVIPLRHRTVEEMIPILQPMLPRDGSISGTRGQLIVRTTPANLAEIRKILDKIDAPARQLMISVAQNVLGESSRAGAEVSGGSREGVRARIYDSRSAENVQLLQTLRVMEGRSAYIMVGQSRPVNDRRVVRSIVGGRMVEHVVEGTEYRDADTGFYVTPRLAGDRVTLDISPQRDVFVENRRATVDTQRVVTSVSGRLGEWIEVGGSSQERTAERGVLLGHAGGARSEARTVFLKVDEVR